MQHISKIKRFIFLTLLINLFSQNIIAGEWKLIDNKTLSFKGNITNNEYTIFLPFYKKSINKLILNSRGGETYAALQIANKLLGQIELVEIYNICASSCANYLFVLGEKKVINQDSLVGYHGNVTATMENRSALRNQMYSQGLSENQIDNLFKNYFEPQVELEREFYSKLGISQDLFDRSYQEDKGMNDGKKYALLAPTKETFRRYGIFNIYGKQSSKQAKAFMSVID